MYFLHGHKQMNNHEWAMIRSSSFSIDHRELAISASQHQKKVNSPVESVEMKTSSFYRFSAIRNNEEDVLVWWILARC
jgi:hypothetical protein